MPGRDASPDFIEALARGLGVIRAFQPRQPVMTLTAVADATGLARPTARRILLTLEQLGYVRAAGRGFELTPRVLEAAPGRAHVAELLQGEQDAARGRPGEAGGIGHGGQGHDRLARLEGAYHAKTAGERLDEIGAGVAAWHAVLSVS